MASTSSAEEFRRIEPEEFFRQHIEQGLRTDGRTSLSSLREVSLSVGSVASADGSAIVKQGHTVVTCGVTLELACPKAEEPDKGFLVPNVDLPPICHGRFKPGPPSEQAQVLSQFLHEVLKNSGFVDIKGLCIRQGVLAWVVNIDVVCLNYDGNVIDASLKAVVAALRNTRLPKVVIAEDDVGEEVADEEEPPASLGQHGVMAEDELRQKLKVIPDQTSPLPLNGHPVSCTSALFDGHLLVDPTDEEEELSSSLISVVVDSETGDLVHVRKAGGSSASREQLQECTMEAKRQAKKIKKMIEKAAPLKGL